ncbi:MAG: twin-arginine translocase TatA/TatE family subunit [Actinomycetota bacterium]
MPAGAEWLIVAGVVVLLFGARKLPELARSLGRSSREFKRGLKEGEGETDEPARTPEDTSTET